MRKFRFFPYKKIHTIICFVVCLLLTGCSNGTIEKSSEDNDARYSYNSTSTSSEEESSDYEKLHSSQEEAEADSLGTDNWTATHFNANEYDVQGVSLGITDITPYISVGKDHILGILKSGKVAAKGYNRYRQCNVEEWDNISSVFCGDSHSIGIRQDGSVIAIGLNSNNQCNIKEWGKIASVAAGKEFTVGLNNEGTLFYSGIQSKWTQEITGWKNVCKIDANSDGLIALLEDGTLLLSSNLKNKFNIDDWADIIDVSMSNYYIIAKRLDGRILINKAYDHESYVFMIEEVIGISAGDDHCAVISGSGVAILRSEDLSFRELWSGEFLQIDSNGSTLLGLKTDGGVCIYGSNIFEYSDINNIQSINTLCSGSNYCIGITENNNVFCFGTNEALERINGELEIVTDHGNIVEVAGGTYFIAILYEDGKERTILLNENNDAATDLPGDLIHIIAGNTHLLGLTPDSHVIASGWNDKGQCNTETWSNVSKVVCGSAHSVCLFTDGTVAAIGDNICGQCNVDEWKEIVDIAAGSTFTIGLKRDGSVVSVGEIKNSEIDIVDWRNIIAIASGLHHVVGLREDGLVLTTGQNYYGQCNTNEWHNVNKIICGFDNTFGFTTDGTLLCAGAGLSRNDWIIKTDELLNSGEYDND